MTADAAPTAQAEKLPTTSPTQIENADLCKRQFVFNYVLGLRPPQGPEAGLGDRVHGHLERWLKNRVVPPDTDEGRIARVGLDHLPEPGTLGMIVEDFVKVPVMDAQKQVGVLRGRLDLAVLARRYVLVHDHKTRGNFRYIAKPVELVKSVQMISYAKNVLDRAPEAEGAVLSHLYLNTSSPAARPVITAQISRAKIYEQWLDVERKARGVIALKLARPDPEDVEPNPRACDMFKGCPFRDRCKIPKERALEGVSMSFLDNILKKGNGAAAEVQLPPVEPPKPAQAAAPVQFEVPPGYYCPAGYTPIAPSGGRPRMTNHTGRAFWMPEAKAAEEAAETVSTLLGQPPAQPTTQAVADQQTLQAVRDLNPAQAAVTTVGTPEGPKFPLRDVGVLPPDAPARDAYKTLEDVQAARGAAPASSPLAHEAEVSLAKEEAAPPVSPLAALQAKADQAKAEQVARAQVVVADKPAPAPSPDVEMRASATVTTDLAVAEAAQKQANEKAAEIATAARIAEAQPPAAEPARTRKKKSSVGEIPGVYVPPPGGGVLQVQAQAQEPEAAPPLELWIDCAMVKGSRSVTSAEEWVRPALEAAAKLAGAGIPDWRAADFGKGSGYLFKALADHAAANGVPSGVVALRSSMAGFDVVYEILSLYAKVVVAPAYVGRR